MVVKCALRVVTSSPVSGNGTKRHEADHRSQVCLNGELRSTPCLELLVGLAAEVGGDGKEAEGGRSGGGEGCDGSLAP